MLKEILWAFLKAIGYVACLCWAVFGGLALMYAGAQNEFGALVAVFAVLSVLFSSGVCLRVVFRMWKYRTIWVLNEPWMKEPRKYDAQYFGWKNKT